MRQSVSRYVFEVNKESGTSYARSVALAAMILAPGYLFFFEGISNLYALLAFTLFAGSVPYILRWLRGLAGGIESIIITEDAIELNRKKTSEILPWVDVASVTFEHVNETPWIMLKTNDDETQRVLLEDFEETDQQQIYELIVGELPDKTREKSTWIIGNRIPMTIYDRDVTTPLEVESDKPEQEVEKKKFPIADMILLVLLLASGVYYSSQAFFGVSTLFGSNNLKEALIAYEEEDFDKAYASLQASIADGDKRGFVLLGDMYFFGESVTIDYAKAAEWYQKALAEDENEVGALNNLGILFKEGIGVTKDLGKAKSLFQQAATLGVRESQHELAGFYLNGLAGEKDIAKAVEYFEMAANQGFAGSQLQLAEMYRKGSGIEQDYTKSAQWYQLAAEQGLAEAQFQLGYLYRKGRGVEQNDAEALKWYQSSADQGSSKGQNGLAYMYQKGLAIEQDYAKAIELYRAAGDANHAGAQLNLGFMYFKGMGVSKDLAQSYKWWALSAANGNKKAKKNIGIIAKDMSEAQLAEAANQVSKWRAAHQ